MSTPENKILSPDQLAGLACVVCGTPPQVGLPFEIETPTSTHVFRCETCNAERDQVARWVAYSTELVVVVGYPRVGSLAGTMLQGPRDPAQVKKDGYGFTRDQEQAWPFPNQKQAHAKARIVDRHMGWGDGVSIVETRSNAAANQAEETRRDS